VVVAVCLRRTPRRDKARSRRRLLSRDLNCLSRPDVAITFSDFLTGWFELTWPKLAKAASSNITELLESALEDALGKFPTLHGEVTYTVKFGDMAPEILEVYSYQKFKGADEGALVCGHMRWDADLEMEVCVGFTSIGIDKMVLEGVGCIVAQPLMAEFPVLGGVQIFFCSPPELTLHFKGLGGVTSWSLVDNLMTKVMHETFSNMMVLPNRMPIRFAGTKLNDYPEFKNPPPKGMLRVHVLKASHLIGADYNLFSARTSDPYCSVTLSKVEWRTRTVMKTCNPQWGTPADCSDFLIYHERQTLQLAVYDESLLAGDACLGSIPPDFTVHDLLLQQRDADESIDLALDTSAVKGHDSPSHTEESSVTLKLQYFEFKPASQDGGQCSDLESPALLSVKLYHVSGIPHEHAKGIRIRVCVGKHEQVSKKSKGIHPKETFGLGSKNSRIMHSLAKDGVPVESIAKAFGLTPGVVEEIILAQSGKPCRFGWDQTIHVLVDEPSTAPVCLEIRLQEKWYPLGIRSGSITDLLAYSKLAVEDATAGGKCWRVLDHHGGVASVGVVVEVRTATRMEDAHAVSSFEVGRFGGQSTLRGTQALEQFRSRRSTALRQSSERSNSVSSLASAPEVNADKPRLRRSERIHLNERKSLSLS